MRRTLVTTCWLFAIALVSPIGIAEAQDAAKGEAVYTAQKCSLCHAIAGKGNKLSPLDGVGAKLSADDTRAVDHPPHGDGGQDEVHEEAAHAGQVRQAARSRSRRAGRLHAEPEVAELT